MPTEETNNIAVLIDAENVDPAYAGHIMSYAYSLGNVCIREIYGSGISLNEWADPILMYSIHTNFTLRPNRYKNSSDICLVIGAMEILAATREGGKGAVAAVVIASSDSDFSALAVHLRSAGIDVIGMGEAGRVNPMWPRACTDFIPLEAKTPLTRKREETPTPAAAPAQEKKTEQSPAKATEKQPAQATEQLSDPSGSTGNQTAETGKKQQKAETDKSRKKKETVKIAPTHKARMEIIRGLITEEIVSHDGQIKSGDLFRVISANPEYKYDQQRSRRAPMDYLKTQYGIWFNFEPQENGVSLITLKEIAQPEQAAESAATSAAGEASEPNGEQAGKTTEPKKKQSGKQAKGKKEVKAEETLSPMARQLKEAGIPQQDAARVEETLAGCRNLRDSYNHLRQAFGNETGKRYQQMIKDAGIQFGN